MNLPIVIRRASQSDAPFVFATWMRSVRVCSSEDRGMSDRNFYALHHRRVELTLRDPATTALIATPNDDPDILVGYLVARTTPDRPFLEFAYTKGKFRRLGVFTALLGHANIDVDRCDFRHWTRPVDWMIKRWPGAKHSPWEESSEEKAKGSDQSTPNDGRRSTGIQ